MPSVGGQPPRPGDRGTPRRTTPLLLALPGGSPPDASRAKGILTAAAAVHENLQASLGAAQNRFTGIATSQQDESTDLSSAQSQITDADFATETANLSSAQVLQQAGISVLAQANSLPQSVLKLLQ